MMSDLEGNQNSDTPDMGSGSPDNRQGDESPGNDPKANVMTDERSQRQHSRSEKNDQRVLSLQMFSSMCDMITETTLSNEEFLDKMTESFQGMTPFTQSDIDDFMQHLDSKVKDISDIFVQLTDLNKAKTDKTQEKTHRDFISGVDEFREIVSATFEQEQAILDERKKLEAKLKIINQQNEALKRKINTQRSSQVSVQPLTSAPLLTTGQVSNASPSPPPSSDSPTPTTQSDHQWSTEWIKDFTKELTTGLAETLGNNKQSHRRHKKALEPEVFSGNVLDFHDWEVDWDMYVQAEDLTETEALRFIKKYLSGKAKDSVIGLLGINTPQAYREVRRKLKERFSQDQDIAGIFKKRIRQWPPIREPDGDKLTEYGDFLDHIHGARSSVPGLACLDEKEYNEMMCYKLPSEIKVKWVDIIHEHKMTSKGYPTFTEFVAFAKQQAFLYSNPIMRQRPQDSRHKPQPQQPRPNKSYNTTATGSGKQYCHQCDNHEHTTPDCPILKKMTYKEVMTFVSSKRLCFRCAKHRGMAKDCKSKMICGICSRNHATILHNPEPATKKDTTETTTQPLTKADATAGQDVKHVKSTFTKKTTYNMVVPVYISSGGREKLVYALLDTGSDSCYINEKVASEIKAEGKTKPMTMVTMNAQTRENVMLFQNLRIRGYMTNSQTTLDAYATKHIACSKDEIASDSSYPNLSHLQGVGHKLPPDLDIPVGLLIGGDCPQAIMPLDSRPGRDGEPFAVNTMFGWTLCGGKAYQVENACLNTKMDSIIFSTVEDDFKEVKGQSISQQDAKFLKILDSETYQDKDGTLVMPLPFKTRPTLPSNKEQALKRLYQIKGKLDRDEEYRTSYTEFMNKLISKGHAEIAPDQSQSSCWYLPHFGVKHPKKQKLRVVFDASAKHGATALNDWLLKGPDHINDLVGILMRFRMGKYAITCDVESMFYNFKVEPKDRDFLRFLWFDEDMKTTQEYRMTRHIFGATSSPGVATYGLRRLAQDHTDSSALQFITKNFYVDDGVTSVDTLAEAQGLITGASSICEAGNLRLHKFNSNSQSLLDMIPETDRSVQQTDRLCGEDNGQRTLGMEWNTVSDSFHFKKDTITPKPQTKRGILSTVAQVFDPMGLLAPVILRGKNILQDTCRDKLDWDQALSPALAERWELWQEDLANIDKVSLPRHIKPDDFVISTAELHTFSDASEEGYGACSYLRLIDTGGRVHCALLLGKARVSPIKRTTIPRMELQGAVAAAEQAAKIRAELQIKIDREYYWCDSTIVLAYIKNDSKKFQVYVANRVSQICSMTNPKDWYHVPGQMNPADHASRGAKIDELLASNWFSGPEFLWDRNLAPVLKTQPKRYELDPGSAEIKKVHHTSTTNGNNTEEKFSCWNKLVRATSNAKRVLQRVKAKVKPYWDSEPLSAEDIKTAENQLITQDQGKYFPEEMSLLLKGEAIPGSNKISQLSPFLDADGVLRVGGRVQKSILTTNEKHPRLIPKQSHLAQLLISHYHEKAKHQGRIFTHSLIRQAGFWIIGAQTLIKSHLRNCVICKRLRGVAVKQMMGLLPSQRVEQSPPFTHVGVDTFGHFNVKERRTELKRWCLIFTCMFSRAVHIEVVDDLSTDSFLQALRCLESIRGPVSSIFSDNGTNFVGAKSFLQHRIEFHTNPPGASHQGGVWERGIRTIRSIFYSMQRKFSGRLDTKGLRTAMYEVMSLINSKPLTTTNLNDPQTAIITPQHLLTSKSTEIIQTKPGTTDDKDVYAKLIYQRTQQFAQQFWIQWKDYLTNLQKRQKWKNPCSNLQVGNIVAILDDNTHRGQWKVGAVDAVYPGKDGLVRSAKIRIADPKQISLKGERKGDAVFLTRPVQKLLLLVK